MKLVIISDTHGLHGDVELPEGDVLIHCGDWSGQSTHQATVSFANWFKKQAFEHKICVAGNHDRYASSQYFEDGEGVHYLQDSSVIIEGFKFYGMPWTPTFFDWFWMKERGPEMKAKTDLIPRDTDVLITHGPAYGVMDKTLEGDVTGCRDLEDRVRQIPQLLVHCFGHIHEQYAHMDISGIVDSMFPGAPYLPLHVVNASQVDRQYRIVNKPVEITI